MYQNGHLATGFGINSVGKIPLGLKRKDLRIVVTGGAGFVGSHLVDRLIARGDCMIVVDNFFTGRKENLVHHFGNPRFELIRYDVVEPLLLEVDQIYHLACPASTGHLRCPPVPSTAAGLTLSHSQPHAVQSLHHRRCCCHKSPSKLSLSLSRRAVHHLSTISAPSTSWASAAAAVDSAVDSSSSAIAQGPGDFQLFMNKKKKKREKGKIAYSSKESEMVVKQGEATPRTSGKLSKNTKPSRENLRSFASRSTRSASAPSSAGFRNKRALFRARSVWSFCTILD